MQTTFPLTVTDIMNDAIHTAVMRSHEAAKAIFPAVNAINPTFQKTVESVESTIRSLLFDSIQYINDYPERVTENKTLTTSCGGILIIVRYFPETNPVMVDGYKPHTDVQIVATTHTNYSIRH